MTSQSREPAPRSAVDQMFDEQVQGWRDVYYAEGLHGLIYRRRLAMALAWIDDLRPGSAASALEVGSGAGLLTVELARRGLAVTSTDASSGMVEMTARQVRRDRVEGAVITRMADVHQLPFSRAQFDLVVALGVIPWLHDPRRAVAEMVRVVCPGGLLVISADNRWRLSSLIDENPLLRALYRRLTPSRPRGMVRSSMHTPPTVNRWLRSAGAPPVRTATLGFGPLELAGRSVLSETATLRLDHRLQTLSDRATPVVRWTGWHYLVAARKTG